MVEDLISSRKILIEYLNVMLKQEDFHGVRDVCVDIEKIDAVLQALGRG